MVTNWGRDSEIKLKKKNPKNQRLPPFQPLGSQKMDKSGRQSDSTSGVALDSPWRGNSLAHCRRTLCVWATQSINEESAYIQVAVLYWAMDKNDYCSDFCLGVSLLMYILALYPSHIFAHIHSAFALSKPDLFPLASNPSPLATASHPPSPSPQMLSERKLKNKLFFFLFLLSPVEHGVREYKYFTYF